MKRNEPDPLDPIAREKLRGLIKRHYRSVHAFLCSYVRDHGLADDLTQDCFVEVIPGIDFVYAKDEDSQGAYLRGIARNLARANFRRMAKLSPDPHTGVEHLLAGKTVIDDGLNAGYLKQCLESLPEHARELVNQHYFKAISCKRLAESMGKSAASVRMALMRIRGGLRDCIANRIAQEGAS